MKEGNHSEGRSYISEFVDFYHQSSFGFGAADIFCCGPFNADGRIAVLVYVLLMARDKQGKRPYSEIVVILPPVSPRFHGNDEASVRRRLSSLIEQQRGDAVPGEEAAVLRKLVKVVRCRDFEIRSAVEMIERAVPNSIVILRDAAKYRDRLLKPRRRPSGEMSMLPEDVWAVHLHALAERSKSAADQTQCYVVLDAGEFTPFRQDNFDLLSSVDGCGIFGGHPSNDLAEVIAAKGDEWIAEIEAGHIGPVLSSVDALPESMASEKALLKIQIFHRVRLHGQAVELIRAEIGAGKSFDPEVRVKLARFAEDAGASELASDLLKPAIPLLVSQDWLEAALALSSEIGSAELERECVGRLGSLFPHSHRLFWHRLMKLLRAGKYEEIDAELANESEAISAELAAFYRTIASGLGVASEPHYPSLLSEIKSRWPSRASEAQLICGEDARRRRLFREALALSMPMELEGNLARRSALLLLRTIEQLLLQRGQDGAPAIDPAELEQPVLKLVRYLSRHPGDGFTRTGLTRLLSVQVTGSLGLPVIATVTLNLARKMVVATESHEIQAQPARDPYVVLRTFFEAAIPWLDRQSPVAIGRLTLPKEILTAPADELLAALFKLLQDPENQLADETDIKFLEKQLALGLSVAAHSNTPDANFTFLRLAAAKLAIAGRSQRARDLAELALQLAGEQSGGARLAWFAFADIYHRVHNFIEALVGLACALGSEVPPTLEQAWYEIYGLIRLLRDLKMGLFAKSLLPAARDMLKELRLEQYNHRLVFIELGIRVREVLADSERRNTEIESLLADAESHCKAVSGSNDEIAPSASLLAQVIYACIFIKVPVPSTVYETLESALTKVGEPTASLIRTTSVPAPRAAEVLALADRTETALYPEDTGFDLRPVVIAARRLLDSEEASGDPRVAAFAVELLADHAIRTSIAEAESERPIKSVPSSIEEPARFAEEISKTGIDVSLLGMGESGRLARVTAVNGCLGSTVYESEDVFSRARLYAWSEDFPYRYGYDSRVPNLFYTTMRGLGLTIPHTGRTLLVMDTALQQLPPNLLVVSDDFIGRQTAVAAIPSLSWLRANRSRRNRSARSVAWISTAVKDGKDPTLGMVADRLRPVLESHGIELDTGDAIPQGLNASDLVIVAAHGGIVPEGRFFQVVTDDADLRVSSSALSRTLRSVRAVVLFVCNAGRFDEHPMASTTRPR